MKESIRTRGVSANGATAATPASKIAVTAIADQVCRDVGGSVANPIFVCCVTFASHYCAPRGRHDTPNDMAICLPALALRHNLSGRQAKAPTPNVHCWVLDYDRGSVNDDVRWPGPDHTGSPLVPRQRLHGTHAS